MRRATLRPGSAEAPDPAAPHARAAGGAAALARLAGALDCLERLLTGAFPAPVPLPGGAVLALAGRMLAMDTGPVAEGAPPPPRPRPRRWPGACGCAACRPRCAKLLARSRLV